MVLGFFFFFCGVRREVVLHIQWDFKSVIQLSDTTAVQALYKRSLDLIFHSSEDFIQTILRECVLFFHVKSQYLWHKLNFSDELQTKNTLWDVNFCLIQNEFHC